MARRLHQNGRRQVTFPEHSQARDRPPCRGLRGLYWPGGSRQKGVQNGHQHYVLSLITLILRDVLDREQHELGTLEVEIIHAVDG